MLTTQHIHIYHNNTTERWFAIPTLIVILYTAKRFCTCYEAYEIHDTPIIAI